MPPAMRRRLTTAVRPVAITDVPSQRGPGIGYASAS